jgi:catechol 2,3-dioxygenase-like lactoylglutathione lyase family enzyme
MIAGGNATLLVADLDRALRFYVEALGFKLRAPASPHSTASASWAEVDAGGGLVLALHRAQQADAARKPGAPGSISVGFEVNQPIAEVVAVLSNRGVRFHGPVREEGAVKLAFFSDPDDNALYLVERDPAE